MQDKKLVVITGASSGIGAATARAFSEAGHSLLLLARRVERMESLSLPNAMCLQVDVTDREAFEHAVRKGEAEFGPTDCLVNNSGVMLLGDIADQDPGEWQRMYDVNVLGVLYGMQSVLPGMKARKGGTIINVSSVAGRHTFPSHAAYCGTKFAVHAIGENVRKEVALDNVRVTTIAPGAVETELLGHTTSDEIKAGYEDWKREIGGAITSEDIAKTILFAYQMPQNVCVRELVVAATKQEP